MPAHSKFAFMFAVAPVIVGSFIFTSVPVKAQSTPTTPVLSKKECSPGTLLEPNTGDCLPVRDVRDRIRKQPKLRETVNTPPSLLELRKKQGIRLRTVPSPEANIPPPGGIGVGTTYKVGALQALESGQLHTKMFVQPDGLNPSTLGLDWLFTTATNRVEKGVEVVGIYFRDDPSGGIGVFDWSCSSNYPCEGGETGPAWVWTSDFSNFSCNITEIVDKKAHLQKVMQYVNRTDKLDHNAPPLWQNEVYLLNLCDGQWDLVWQHQYRDNQIDCSVANECAWWGPILETFPSDSGEPIPEIKELGFEDALLMHDSIWSELSPIETNFDPPISPWVLFHLEPNRSYGVGNYFTQANFVVNNLVTFEPISSTYQYSANPTGPLFFDDFDGPNLNPIWQASLPNAAWRFGAGAAIFQGASNFSFQSLGGSSVIRLQTILGDAQRRGWSSSTSFPSDAPIVYEARFNTLFQSSSTGIDELLEIWLLDSNNPGNYDIVALSAPGYGSGRVFTAGSSITNVGLDTNFPFTNTTWYHMVISGSMTQEVRASVYNDAATVELIGVNLGHNLSAYASGFRIGISQSMGLPGFSYPTDVAIDSVRLTASPCPSGFVGKYGFDARLTNTSNSLLSGLEVKVTTLTGDNLLQNADGGNGGVGSTLTVLKEDGYSDGILSPREFVDVNFNICLKEKKPFTFFVDVLGLKPNNAVGLR